MRLLRWLFLVVFVLAFLHTSLVVGMIHQLPLGGQLYEGHLQKTSSPVVYYPAKVYGFMGRLIWNSGTVDWILERIYRPIFQKVGQEAGSEKALKILDVRLWNIVTLASLALTLLSFVVAGRKNRYSRLYR